MVDQEMLQAISQMIDAKLEAQDKRTDEKLTSQRKEIMHDVTVLMDAEFKPRFNLLAEDLTTIHEKLEKMDQQLERIEDKVAIHEIKLKIME